MCVHRQAESCKNKQQQERTASEQLQHILVGRQLHPDRGVQIVLQESPASRRISGRHANSVPVAEKATDSKREHDKRT